MPEKEKTFCEYFALWGDAVTEIKKPKDGAMEIKFFDRLKALEKMGDFDKESSKKQSSLFDAIKNGAKALEKADDYGED